MRLPNSHKAVVEIEKIRDYSLNPNHPVGQHKARVFSAALGLTREDAEWLRKHALEIAGSNDALPQPASVFGDNYVIDSDIEYEGKSALVQIQLDCRIWYGLSSTDELLREIRGD